MTSSRVSGSFGLALLVVAVFALDLSVHIANGAQHPEAMRWLLTALPLVPLVVLLRRFWILDRLGECTPLYAALLGAMLFIAIHLTTTPAIYLQAKNFDWHHYLLAAAAVAVGFGFAVPNPRGPTLAALVVTFMALGLWILANSTAPFIDVVTWHKEAYAALARGECPYSISIPNIYGHTLWYAPGTADAARVYRGYLYPPMALFLGAPGQWLAHDYRYANLFAMGATGVLIGAARTRLAFGAAALFLFAPRGFFVLEQGWTEATALFMLALTVYASRRWPRALPYVFGAMLVTKQYLVLLAPLFPFLLPRPWSLKQFVAFAWRAAVTAAVVTLPLALWDFRGFWKAVVEYQGIQPYRPDSLSLMSWTANPNGVPVVPKWLSFATIPVTLALTWWRAPRTPAGFALGGGLVFLMFFATAKQAFCNYYFFVAGMLCVALGAFAFAFESISRRGPAGEAASAPTADTETPT
jgi:hypothetical protein